MPYSAPTKQLPTQAKRKRLSKQAVANGKRPTHLLVNGGGKQKPKQLSHQGDSDANFGMKEQTQNKHQQNFVNWNAPSKGSSIERKAKDSEVELKGKLAKMTSKHKPQRSFASQQQIVAVGFHAKTDAKA